MTQCKREALPEQAAGLVAPVANGVGDDLTGAAAQRQPHPSLVFASRDERPEFVEFQHISELGWDQRRRERRQLAGFFDYYLLATRSGCCAQHCVTPNTKDAADPAHRGALLVSGKRMSLKLFTLGTVVGLLLCIPEGAAAVMATVALVSGLIPAVADDVLALAVGALNDLDDHARSLPSGPTNNTLETTTRFIQGVRYACLGGGMLCLGAITLVLWQHGFTGKWRLAVVLLLVFAACFYGQMYQATRLAKTVRKLTQASA